jgi:hypothetical protein
MAIPLIVDLSIFDFFQTLEGQFFLRQGRTAVTATKSTQNECQKNESSINHGVTRKVDTDKTCILSPDSDGQSGTSWMRLFLKEFSCRHMTNVQRAKKRAFRRPECYDRGNKAWPYGRPEKTAKIEIPLDQTKSSPPQDGRGNNAGRRCPSRVIAIDRAAVAPAAQPSWIPCVTPPRRAAMSKPYVKLDKSKAAWRRMEAAGAQLMTWFGVACELHRDWRNDIEGLGTLFASHIPDYRNLINSYTTVQNSK